MYRFPKIPARYSGIVTPLLLTFFMICIVSLINTLRGIGLAPDFLGVWLSAWGLSWLVAFPSMVVALPFVRRLTLLFVEKDDASERAKRP